MMAAAIIDFGLNCPGLPQMSATQGLVPYTKDLSSPASNVGCAKCQAPCQADVMPPEEVHSCSWQPSFSCATRWWDNRQSTLTVQYPDSRRKKSKGALWQNHQHKPALGDSHAADGMKKPPDSVSISVQGRGGSGKHDDHLEVGMCRKLCEDGRINDAVDALKLLVQRGFHVHNSLFYLVLKRCIAREDLILGRRIHALTIESGYEGDSFLATHLIRLYSAHGRLEDAMRVFTDVSKPDTYNWATIIFAYARHGECAQAIRLYRQMRQSATVTPTDHIYVAVLKACAATGDLITGKEIHTHILASPRKSNIFVQTGLVNMYANCGNLEAAHEVFERLTERDVVTWTAMIAGYTQQGMGQKALNLFNRMQEGGLTPPNVVTFVCLLHACASVGLGALHQGKQLHAQIERQGLQNEVVLCGSLVNMYAKCGGVEDARSMFDRLRDKDVVTWNAMLTGYVQQGLGKDALSLYSCMEREGITPPDSVTLACLLQACASVGEPALQQGKELHSKIEGRELQADVVLAGSLVNMYAKCHSLEDARNMFDRLPEKDVVTWNAMFTGYVQQGMCEEALSLYNTMQQEGISPPSSVTFACLLQACASVGVRALHQGKQLHAQIEELGLQADVVLGTCLVDMYAKCCRLEDARSIFDQLRGRNIVTWTAMIAGYARQGLGEEALHLYSSMENEGISPNCVTFVCLLQACASEGISALQHGKRLHSQIEERGWHVLLGGSLVNMYAKCSSLVDARSAFCKLSERDVVAWNAMLACYAERGMTHEALHLYSCMQQEGINSANPVTFVCLLQVCASFGVGALHQGKQLHTQIEEQRLEVDVVLGGSLVHMYAKCGSVEDARIMFDSLVQRDVVTWNVILAGYVQEGRGKEALTLFSCMQQEGLTSPDCVTFICLLQACACVGAGALHQGKQLHAQIEERGLQADVRLGTCLIDMYAKCGSIENSRSIFDSLRCRDVVAWTAMIAGYVQQGMGEEALILYSSMQQEGLTTPDSFTFVCLLHACASAAALPLARQLHAQIEKRGLQADEVVGAALVHVYAKCGNMFESQQMFDSLPTRTIEAWNALTGGYSRQGDSEAVFTLVDKMTLEGLQPDSVTFLSILTVCSHVGLVEEGRKYFEVMRANYGISPTVEHYTCMMDLLGRAGQLDEALQLAKIMPFPPNGIVWLTLLGACHVSGLTSKLGARHLSLH